MFWRLEQGERFDEIKGPKAKRRMKALVESGKARGILAFDGDEPIGWCALGRRTDFAKLNRAPSLRCDDAEQVWSLPCFFVKNGYRGKGVAKALLQAALAVLRRSEVETVEAYPVRPKVAGQKIPPAFAWTGTRALFDPLGFQVVGNEEGGKQRMRKKLRR
jgi:predicted GNAT family acetyltransferase